VHCLGPENGQAATVTAVNIFLWISAFMWLFIYFFFHIFSIKETCCYFCDAGYYGALPSPPPCRTLSHSQTRVLLLFPLYITLIFPMTVFSYHLLSVYSSNISANDYIPTHSSRTSNLAYLSNFLICFPFLSFLPSVTSLGDQAMWQYLCNSLSCFVYYLLSKRYSNLITQMFFDPNEFNLC